MKVEELAKRVARAKKSISLMSSQRKNEALRSIADSIDQNRKHILEGNIIDVDLSRKNGMPESIIDRLLLDNKRIDSMIDSINRIIELDDPIGKIDNGWTLPNGLRIMKVRVPIGAIGMIYEGRPNVTVDSAILCLKSGNTVLLKGSASAQNSNANLVDAIKSGLKKVKFDQNAVELIDDTSHKAVEEMIKMREYLDLVIPRGGKSLIDFVVQNATVPTLETGAGNCHIFVDESADFDMALKIIENAKVQRPGTCNAAEKVLIHQRIAGAFLPMLYNRLKALNVEMRGCEESLKIVPSMKKATDEDWSTEYLDLILGIKIVKDVDEAIDHIAKYGTKHSESIITNDYKNALKFTSEIDAAALYVNASTRFTDGGEFGFGSEIGISTQKFHARGPVGLNELTSYKYVIHGEGQIRS
ncbi:MAG: glutamate-5-semialdehyde dehydrogenase [Mesoaciditoga sp.]|uniref:glutamate-5-semialdehyde dehydrogenase n=1 Tax=Athalassotoga sp. TaxID=2022597 RepID=UPI000CBAEE98|nr:MAG: glutamate-5-semialdehyde dehydrogenase [Mesoaciditoga sp.]PMP79557.1 MAG: glutamate-5-semialdehyde dehydrogenase [Mesoaciditoga sp.]HEU24812.1 glutamate-5-semialdehyde dehydrogenase [Mesoaciditoga lauensis]